MTGPIRVQVEHYDPDGLHTTHALTIDPPDLDPAELAVVADVAQQLLADLRALGINDPAGVAIALAIEDLADERAYARIAQRRGVLPL